MTSTNQFTYNGRRSYEDMNLIVTKTPAFVSAERDIEYIKIPGRSGDIIVDNGGYRNVTREYAVTLISEPSTFADDVKKIAAWLNSAGGYSVLTDTYDPNYFRYARHSGQISIANMLSQLGTATLKFNCKPYKYSFEGQKEISIAATDVVNNPEEQPSIPYMKIVADGDIKLIVNDHMYEIFGVDGFIELDGALLAAYKGERLQNDKISFTSFPVFEPGENNISVVGNVSSVSIIPRWCAL